MSDVLQTVRGVSQVVIDGEKRFAIRIWLDAHRMAARAVTINDVERELKEQNVELASGRVENLDRRGGGVRDRGGGARDKLGLASGREQRWQDNGRDKR